MKKFNIKKWKNTFLNEAARIVLINPTHSNNFIKTVIYSGPNRDADKEVEKLNAKLSKSQKENGFYWKIITFESVNEGKFKVDDLVYNKRTKTVGIVRMGDDKYGEVKTDADGNVSPDELEKYNPIKFKHQTKAKVAPSTEKEVNSRGLFNPFKNESVTGSDVVR